AQAGVPADTLEGMVLLESAGRSNAVAGDDGDLSVAVGLTQILAETGQNLLGMRIDVERSEKLTARLERAFERGRTGRARELRRERARIDERFDPQQALAATARYLRFAQGELGRVDLAVVSYHMGVGNLRSVLELFGEDDVSYAQLYFAATPRAHPETYAKLLGLGDSSSTYLWRVGAAQDIMELWRTDPQRLQRRQALHDEKNSSEEVLHPESETEVFADREELEDAYASGDLLALDRDRLRAGGLRLDRDMGQLARDLDRSRRLYRGLRPGALAVLIYLGTGVAQISGDDPLFVTSTARDRDYQNALLEDGNGEATRDYSLHTTGFAFDIERRYVSDRQSQAFQFMLDRLQALNVIAWVREPAAIHVTVGPRGEELLGVLEG
ncbi:MAG TPA: transglycosylase SLT domain-containing protein, partial [Solirubrobacteraceae bacterium]|nr:transglycosylase SLT domain-containing protein [Solirubrobacteraceae bacterium]